MSPSKFVVSPCDCIGDKVAGHSWAGCCPVFGRELMDEAIVIKATLQTAPVSAGYQN